MASPELEIERLLSEIADEGATRETVDQLQAILLNRPDLQGHYARVMALHTLLKFELDLSVLQFSPLVEGPLVSEPGRRGPRGDSMRSWRRHWQGLAALAASVAALFAGGYLARDWAFSAVPPVTIRSDAAAAKVETLALLSNLTHTALSDVTLPARSAVDVGLTLCSGAVWMERGAGQQERGYMIEVPPGGTIVVAVDADAGVHNTLAVVELDAAGRPTGSVMSFKNDKNVASDKVLVGGGLIADWSERNNSTAARYYLFTGTHRPQKSKDRRWHLSDYAVLLQAGGLTYLGWDDSGYTAVANPTGGDYYADKDYDDISAIIQVRTADFARQAPARVAYSPRQLGEAVAEQGPADDDAAFTVPPGEKALVKISSSAGFHNEVQIVDRKASAVVWRQSFFKASSDYKGAYLIENDSDEVREYFVTGRHKAWAAPGEVTSWEQSPCRLLRDEWPSLVLGFEDGGGDEDFNDAIVHIRRIARSTQVSGQDLL